MRALGVIVSSSRFSAEGMKIELIREGDTRPQITRVVQGAFDFHRYPRAFTTFE